MPTGKYAIYLYAYEVKVNEILTTPNLQLVMLPTIHLKNVMEPDEVSVTLVNLSNLKIKMPQLGSFNYIQNIMKNQNIADLKVNHVVD